MNRAALLERLDKLILAEEQSVPIYLDHIEAVLSWSGFSAKSRQKAQAVMRMLAGESLAHKKMLEGLKAGVRKEGRDVF
ncbi:MAG: hypothetical protein WC728_02665 [Elusimicrobiota bacterium]